MASAMATEAVSAPEGAIVYRNFKLWKWDTKSIVGAVLLAICFTVNMQITERIDTALTGGVLNWFGHTFLHLWFPAACIYFGLSGGLLAANFNPIIAVLTATNPMAPRFFLDNTLYVIPFSLLAMYYLQYRGGYIDLKRFAVMVAVSHFIDSLVAGPATWLLVFNFGFPYWLGLWAILLTVIIPGTFMGYAMCRTIWRSGIVGD